MKKTNTYKYFGLAFGIGLILFVLIGQVSPVFSQTDKSLSISVNSTVDRSTITIGDLIRYSVKITRNRDLQVEVPGLAANLGQFEIRDYLVHDTRESGTFVQDSVDYVITTFDTGSYVIPPLHILIVTGDSTKDTLSTDPIVIRVESVMKGEAKDIRDIKGPLSIAKDWYAYYLYGGIAFAVLLFSACGYWLYKRWKAGLPILPVREETIRPAHETAIEALDKLVESSLLGDGEVKEYHIKISDIIREYIDGRYFIIAPEMTTDQLMDEICRTDIPEGTREDLGKFLQDCDLVKFAKAIPDEEHIGETTRSAYEIVRQTKWSAIEIGPSTAAENENTYEKIAENGEEPGENTEISESGKNIIQA